MENKKRVAGYVKLAKRWEHNRTRALAFHRKFFEEFFYDNSDYELTDVYVDITGYKETYKRPEMLRLLRDCTLGKIDCIFMQTRAYFAANNEELCFLLYFLFELSVRIDIVSADDDGYRLDTIKNVENQREELYRMAKSRVSLLPNEYKRWHDKVVQGMNKVVL